MKNLVALAFAGLLLGTAFQAGLAMDNMHGSMMHGSMMHGSMMMPSCAAGDPVVGVNTKTKMYMSKSQMKAKTAGMSMSEKQSMMMKNHMKMMCKSKADAMGGKMMMSKPM